MAIVISLTNDERQALENLLRLQNPDTNLLNIFEKITRTREKKETEVRLKKIDLVDLPAEFEF